MQVPIVSIIPALKDNYIYLVENSKKAIVIDPAESSPVVKEIENRGLELSLTINTHHHWDHTDGNKELFKKTSCDILAFEGEERIEGVSIPVSDNQELELLGIKFRFIHTPGHTNGHICCYLPDEGVLFVGDTLFSAGCGRLFEGTPQQMFQSFQKIKKLPEETKIYFGHEYTAANIKFALILDPNNKELQSYREEIVSQDITTPTTLKKELSINPFLRAKTPEELSRIRKMKDIS